MDEGYLERLVHDLEVHGGRFDEGLTDREVIQIERQWGFRFPPDLRDILQYALPVSPGFPDWRHDCPTDLGHALRAPIHGMYFDIARSGFWLIDWGARPGSLLSACRTAKAHVMSAPRLIPVFQGCYIPDSPELPGNPVFCGYQPFDMVYGGYDLAGFFANSFTVLRPKWAATAPRPIWLWDDAMSSYARKMYGPMTGERS